MTATPWGLTPAQVKALDAVVDCGCDKEAARRLGVTKKTIEAHTHAARKLMQVRNRVLMVLAYDRWKRQGSTT